MTFMHQKRKWYTFKKFLIWWIALIDFQMNAYICAYEVYCSVIFSLLTFFLDLESGICFPHTARWQESLPPLLFKMVFLPCKNLPELTCETIYICTSCCCYFCWWWFSKITNAQIMKFGLLISWLYPMIYNSFSIRSSHYNLFTLE